MTTNRWYPTVLTLLDGSTMIIGGNTKNLDFDHLTDENNPTYEYWPAKPQGAIHLDILAWAFPHMMYPTAAVLPSGKVFLFVSNKTVLIDPVTDSITNLPDMPQMDHAPWIYPHTPHFLVMPMSFQDDYVMTIRVCGGSKLSTQDASPVCWQVSPDTVKPSWSQVKDLPNARLMPDGVILPDGKILYVNGLGWGQAGGIGNNVRKRRSSSVRERSSLRR
jgi:Glyoxal oxidase N-terminus